MGPLGARGQRAFLDRRLLHDLGAAGTFSSAARRQLRIQVQLVDLFCQRCFLKTKVCKKKAMQKLNLKKTLRTLCNLIFWGTVCTESFEMASLLL